MNILYIVQHFSGPAGSGGSRPYENARRLVQYGHQVTLLCGQFFGASAKDLEYAREAGIEVLQAPVPYGQRMSYLRRLVAFRQYMTWAIRTGEALSGVDLVFASSTPLTVGEIGRKIAAHHRIPFIFEVRDLWPEVPISLGALNNPVLRWMAVRMARRVYAAADHVVALSPDMQRVIIDRWGVPAARVTVIPNCSDTALFGAREGRDDVRRRYGWSDKFVCIHPGAMGLVNGLDYLLDGAKELDRQGCADIHIALLGDGAFKAHLRQRIADEGIRSAAVYDSIPKREMPDLLAASDIGLVTVSPLPYLETNSANKFFDFLAAGMPVVINYGGWQAEVLRESGAGLSVDPHAPATLVRALCSLRDNPAQAAQMGRAGRALAEARYDRDQLAKQLETVLRDVQAGYCRD